MQRGDDEDDAGDVGADLQQDDRLREAQRDHAPEHDRGEHHVVDGAHVAAAPGADAAAAGPEDVGDGAHHPFEMIELGLEQDPGAEERDRARHERPDLRANALGQRRGDAEAADVRAAGQERHVEQRRQRHAEQRADEEHAPLVGAHDAPPARASARIDSRVRLEA